MCYKDTVKCPICGKENLRLAWVGDYCRLEESYYVCPQCSYLKAMVYSPTLEAVCKDYCDNKWLKKARDYGVDVVGYEEYEEYTSMLPRELMDVLEENRKDDENK